MFESKQQPINHEKKEKAKSRFTHLFITPLRNVVKSADFETLKKVLGLLKKAPEMEELVNNKNIKEFFENNKIIIEKLSKSNINFTDNDEQKGIPAIYENGTIFIRSENIENIEEKLEKYKKEKEQIERELIKIEKNLNNQGFLKKAKPEIIEMMKKKKQTFLDKQKRVNNILENLDK